MELLRHGLTGSAPNMGGALLIKTPEERAIEREMWIIAMTPIVKENIVQAIVDYRASNRESAPSRS